jgi:ribosome-binding protein aMBF1 (putative translation factor)
MKPNPLAAWLQAGKDRSGADLARRLGVSRQAVESWAAGAYLPRRAVADRLERLTGVSWLALASWTHERRRATAASAS